ncbi:glycosyltransferase [Phocaeicola salanitronis]|uniref:glycosyltransferase n=1 Tax=Phocaeicola salanitronis TaxID=376805 RepID=UPI00320A0435
MRILIITDIPTSPITGGARKIISLYSNLFKSWGHEVHFLCVNKFNMRKKYRVDIKQAFAATKKEWGQYYHQYDYSLWENIYSNVKIIFSKLFHNDYRKCDDIYPRGLTSEVVDLLHKYDIEAVIVNHFYLSKVLEAIPLKRKALFTHDSFSMYKKSKSKQAAYYLMPKEEKIALNRAPYIFAMQSVEADYFRTLVPNNTILINYCNHEFHPQPIVGNHNILFFSGEHKFNIDGLVWFIENVFSLIKNRFPDVKLLIGGEICNALKGYDNRDNIELVGKIEEPESFFLRGDVAINPCRLGTGLKIKTFESVSYDKVTMVHSNSLVGIYKEEDAPIFSSSNPIEWVEYLDKIWSNRHEIAEIKAKNQTYIRDMNDFIKGQYKIWLEG